MSSLNSLTKEREWPSAWADGRRWWPGLSFEWPRGSPQPRSRPHPPLLSLLRLMGGACPRPMAELTADELEQKPKVVGSRWKVPLQPRGGKRQVPLQSFPAVLRAASSSGLVPVSLSELADPLHRRSLWALDCPLWTRFHGCKRWTEI